MPFTTDSQDTVVAKLISTCPNTIWLSSRADCNSTTTTETTVVKVLRNESDDDIFGDTTFGKFYVRNKHIKVGTNIVRRIL